MKNKPIKGFEEKYIIYEDGRIYNIEKKKFIKITMYKKQEGAYPKAVLYKKNNKRFEFRVHRLVAEHFIPNPNNLKIVNHINGNKKDFHINNLEWCTHSENAIHARDVLNTLKIGERHPFSKITEKDVLEIRKLYNIENKKISEICKINSLWTKSIVEKIVHKVTWKHI